MKKLYITTPIYYSSGKPHIGHAYTTILADVIARYKKLIGYEVFFQTGMDEHGQKIQDKAKEKGMSIQTMLDETASMFKQLWKDLDINYDYFIRTTDKNHEEAVAKTFSKLLKDGFIYKGVWKGYYCVGCEENYTREQAIEKDGKLYCKVGHPLVEKNEESYFLSVSKCVDWLKKQFAKEGFIIPQFRINELVGSFLDKGLEDLSVTRTSFDWGIKVTEDNKHIIYVWLDALLNYITSLGYMSNDDKLFKKYWEDENTEVIHLMSKEITRFHCIYWPIILHMLGLRLPTHIVSHGWVVTKEGKMSKSLGNVIDPYDYINTVGSDAFRYFIIRQVSLDKDGIFSHDLFVETFNSELANNYGNMATRTNGMLKKYFNNIIPSLNKDDLVEMDKVVISSHKAFLNEFAKDIESLDMNALLNKIQDQYNVLNKYIDDKKPWVLAKDPKLVNHLGNCLNIVFNATYDLMTLLKPILVKTSPVVEKGWNLTLDSNKLGFDWANHEIGNLSPLFVRIAKEK